MGHRRLSTGRRTQRHPPHQPRLCIECEQFIRAGHCKRGDMQPGYVNDYKSKKIATPADILTLDVPKTPGADEPFYPERAWSAAAAPAAPSFSPRPASGRLPHTFCPAETSHILPLPCLDGIIRRSLGDRTAHRRKHYRSDSNLLGDTFRSLRLHNYRLWAAGAFMSNVGTWVQRTAQDWLVFTELTSHDASTVGVVMALQFGPQLLFLPWTGSAADNFDQRKLLMATQAVLGALALALGLLTVTGAVQLWHVYVFAFMFGTAAAFDAPVRQTFVSELVGERDLHNAVALNSTSFNAARMIGPAVGGLHHRRRRHGLGVPDQRHVLSRPG